ncbi:homoserine O-acetyltransferase [Trametes versicolor FP-101664 SS1]|uniref:homoserine O-acetyltransferase n=1 Tax=Trametes versicolor (strain FP-101664) TaxID=717944 RepID=UPI000462465C|nr:homoserine O-acetyltransferase [Trametes versicolor FP-101664 SS1]EIW57366.1 homoserine O-acetyltransferase [Trametes versicolor FP-101664 SS1]
MSTFIELLDQSMYHVPSFTLETGPVIKNVPVAYKTWGELNEQKNNVMIICHAFTGSSDVEDWWGPLMGRGKAFDPSRYFIFCANVLGSPYGSASPVTVNPETGKPYGPEFPLTTIRDDVRIHKLVLDHLGVQSVAVVIGGSMGGMAVLEWPLCTPPGYVRQILPIATSARHSAWCISWGEAQRQSIYSDPSYEDGFYTSQPASGLGAARMAALLTYRSRDSFERRFGRKPQKTHADTTLTPPRSPALPPKDASFAAHNDGMRPSQSRPATPAMPGWHTSPTERAGSPPRPPIFSAQSYLRYQGDKFTSRFDANCYIHITRKLDTHDVARGRLLSPDEDEDAALARVLAGEPAGALVIGIESDGLFMPAEQRVIAEHIPGAQLVMIPSQEGHDGFLLEFELINGHILRHLMQAFPEYYRTETGEVVVETPAEDFSIKKTSMFGEAEADITRW